MERLALRTSASRVSNARALVRSARIAACTVRRSHTTVDSRWQVMPTPAMSAAVAEAFSSAPAALASTDASSAIGSISDQPGCGLAVADWSSCWWEAIGRSDSS